MRYSARLVDRQLAAEPRVLTTALDLEPFRWCNLRLCIKRFALEKILDSLLHMQHEGTVPPEITGNEVIRKSG